MRVEEESGGYAAYNNENEKILSVMGYSTTVPINKYEGDEELFTIDEINFYGKGAEQEQEALKEIFHHIRDEFDRYPGIDNHFSKLDGEESELIGLLITKGDIPKQLLLNAEEFIASPNLSDKKVVRNLIDSTANSRTGFSQSGYLPYNSSLKEREPRRFHKERFPQLLRQIATQLYHFCISNELSPTEIQVMYFNDSLFISANSKESIIKMRNLLSTPLSFKVALTTAYNYKGSDSTDKKISSRHAEKLLTRLYSEYPCDDKRFSAVRLILTKEAEIVIVEPSNLEELKNNTIYFVCDKLKADRHAEENLMDILEKFTPDVVDAKLKPAIFGKKRPCFTCHARFQSMSEEMTEFFSLRSTPVDFNPNKGLLFKEAAYRQIRNASSAKASSASLGSYRNVIYTSKEGGSGYATVSDSEIESEETIDREVNSISLDKIF